MKTKILALSVCLLGALSVAAQDVDKALVQAKADAAKDAAATLKSVDTGEKAWKFDGVVGLNAAATGLVNWTAGGKNNVNGVAYAKLHLLYHKNAIAWETNFDTDFGLTYIDQDEDAFQKSSDNIKLATKFGWEFKENWYLTVLGGFQSQYALGRNYQTGYNNPISKWLAPSYTDISVGIDWKKSYNGADFSLYLSPIAGRISTAYVGNAWNERYTKEMWVEEGGYEPDRWNEDIYQSIMADQQDFRSQLQTRYGTYFYNEQGEKQLRDFRAEFGLSFRGGIAYKYENLTLSTTLTLFTPYAWDMTELSSYEDAEVRERNLKEVEGYNPADHYFRYRDMNRRFGYFDADWDVNISYQFLKVLNVTLSTSMKYYNGTLIADKDGNVSERIQFKSVLGLGIGYSF